MAEPSGVEVGAVLILRERSEGESRVAATPETVRRLRGRGLDFQVERGAGVAAGYADQDYADAGAHLMESGSGLGAGVDAVLCVNPPAAAVLDQLRPGALVAGLLAPYGASGLVEQLQARRLSALALELLPRISRAQSMDVLSSQANIAGYKAIMLAADKYQRFFPMLMTAAGTVKAARIVILGVGVAGLQAIATAKRMGAVIEASDVRPSVKEQVESLGAKFIDVPFDTAEEREAAEGVGGYARAMPQSWLDRQKVEVAKRVALADVVVSTALIPGRAAPVLVTEEMVKSMKPGSVIVDLAAGKAADGVAGNCVLTQAGRTVQVHGVTLVGETNLPALVAADASALYARNVLDFLKLVTTKEAAFHLNLEDDIVAACLVAHGGAVTRA